jgi:hypothetical protein
MVILYNISASEIVVVIMKGFSSSGIFVKNTLTPTQTPAASKKRLVV